jgi:hypothetical protein
MNRSSDISPQELEQPGSLVLSYGGKSAVLASGWELGYLLFVAPSWTEMLPLILPHHLSR